MINPIKSEYMILAGLVSQLHGNGVTAERALVSVSTTVLFPHLPRHLVQISQNQSRQSGSLIIIMNRKCI